MSKPAPPQTMIRSATADDAEVLLEFITEHAKFEKEAYSPYGKLEKIRGCLSAVPPPFACLVVDTDEGVQGYCTFMSQWDSWYGEPQMYIDALFLRESLRGSGVGKMLMEKVKKVAESQGLATMRLMAPSDNTGAIKFYEKLGGQHVSKQWFRFQL